MTADDRPIRARFRWGLAARLFAILILLGAIAVLVTGGLGYVRARDAPEETIYNQLTAARESKARQVETYFRNIRNDLRLLAASKMVVDATRDFHAAFEQLEQKPVPDDMKGKVNDWYARNVMPIAHRLLGTDAAVAGYLPTGPAAIYL